MDKENLKVGEVSSDDIYYEQQPFNCNSEKHTYKMVTNVKHHSSQAILVHK